MRPTFLLIAAISTQFFSSCYYRNHMPVGSAKTLDQEVVTMTVGERRKIVSKTVLTNISPGFMLGPAAYLRSSDPLVVEIEGSFDEPVAWARAKSPGKVNIEHIGPEGQFTRVIVIP